MNFKNELQIIKFINSFKNEKDVKIFIDTVNLEQLFLSLEKNNYKPEIFAMKLKTQWTKSIPIKKNYKQNEEQLRILNKISNKSLYKHYCEITGKEEDIDYAKMHIDHIIPQSKGGTNQLSNLRMIVPTENLRKNNKLVVVEKKQKINETSKNIIELARKQKEKNLKDKKNLEQLPQQLDVSHFFVMVSLYFNGIKTIEDLDLYIDNIEDINLYENLILKTISLESAKNEKELANLYRKYNLSYFSRSPNKKTIIFEKMLNDDFSKFSKLEKDYLNYNIILKDNYEDYIKEQTGYKYNIEYSSISNSRKLSYFKKFFIFLIKANILEEIKKASIHLNPVQQKAVAVNYIKNMLKDKLIEEIEEIKRKKYNKSIYDEKVSTTLNRRKISIEKVIKQINNFYSCFNFNQLK